MTWKCHVCGRERPDEKISVFTRDRSVEYGLPVGTMLENVRYCNDSLTCSAKVTTTYLIGKKAPA